jgi:hypothetical protein
MELIPATDIRKYSRRVFMEVEKCLGLSVKDTEPFLSQILPLPDLIQQIRQLSQCLGTGMLHFA